MMKGWVDVLDPAKGVTEFASRACVVFCKHTRVTNVESVPRRLRRGLLASPFDVCFKSLTGPVSVGSPPDSVGSLGGLCDLSNVESALAAPASGYVAHRVSHCDALCKGDWG